MRVRVYQRCLPVIALSVLMAQALSAGAAQKKSPLIWERPVTVNRVSKPYTKPARPLPVQQRAPLLTLQWHLLLRGNGNVPQPVDSAQVFETGDQLKLSITANQDGFLYIINQTNGMPGVVIFPNRDINGGRNDVKKNTDYVLPPLHCPGVPGIPDPNDCWWQMAPPAGTEELIVIFSRDKITTLPSEVSESGETQTVDESVIKDLKAKSRQAVSQDTGPLSIAGRPAVPFTTRVQNTNRKDNEELITTIRLKHGE
ncbi:MAG TPA: DUF4384 domain-containing protein [Blastocatellia bacterium]|nr:DUF4384 domain-containing protein [Blastocatellia bacterium]